MSAVELDNHEKLTGLYARVAPVYDAWTWFTESKSLRVALELAAIRDGERVLEVAVGTGYVFREILRRNPSGRNVGVDMTESMLRRARTKADRSGISFELTIGDARALSFEDASFDVVVNNNMLGLLSESDIASSLHEMERVLRPGGRLVIVMMKRPARGIGEWIYRIGAGRLGGWRDVTIDPLIDSSGLERVSRQRVTQLGIPSEVLVARKLEPSDAPRH